ncbi:hypothetical protein ZOSMA_116G00400 [Zostera marina]|uniref:Uncharacterized protein n=1 Tax=Zostera marina TaxID=29655 RepID=A0A0K9Q481_ZOSMR|nr:hypothetical protein ZOSMA_116G00400 [Zostera marina]
METRRQATPTTKLRQVLGDITNRNTFSRRSGKKVTKSPHFCSAKSSTGSVEWFSQGGDFPSNVALTSGSNRKSDSLGKKRKSAISEDCDEKNRNGEMKKKNEEYEEEERSHHCRRL